MNEIVKKKQKKIVDCSWIMPCVSAVIDKDTNTLSLSNIVEEINVSIPESDLSSLDGTPRNVAIGMDIIVMWKREKDVVGPIKFDMVLQLIDPNGIVLIDNLQQTVSFEPHHYRFRARYRFEGLLCTVSGDYILRAISLDLDKTGKKIVGEETIKFKLMKPNGDIYEG